MGIHQRAAAPMARPANFWMDSKDFAVAGAKSWVLLSKVSVLAYNPDFKVMSTALFQARWSKEV